MQQMIQKAGLEIWLEPREGVSLVGQKVVNIGKGTAYLFILMRKTKATPYMGLKK